MSDEMNPAESAMEFSMQPPRERQTPLDLGTPGPALSEPGEPRVAFGSGGPEVQTVQFGHLAESGSRKDDSNSLDLILDVQLGATVELGRSRMSIREILALGPGSLIELDKLAGEPADLLINGKPLARGEVIVIDENFGIRITEIIAPAERIKSFR